MPSELEFTALIFIPLFGLGMAIWARSLAQIARRQPTLPYEPRRSVSWTGLDVLVLVLSWLALQSLAVGMLLRLQGIDLGSETDNPGQLLVPSIAGSALGNAVAIMVVLMWLTQVRGATLADVGLAGRPLQDIALGVYGFAAASIVIYPLMLLLTRWIKYDHPIMQAVEREPGIDVLLIATMSAVVVAPIAEELIFRVLFQGWLERQRRFWRETKSILPGLNRHTGPILVSASVFGLAHYGNGPAPIPLFFLGLFLGYLYQRTHRLLPCVTLHVCVNALTTVQLWLNHLFPPVAP
jgi:membrane protease YdiL (CAAX protease family)